MKKVIIVLVAILITLAISIIPTVLLVFLASKIFGFTFAWKYVLFTVLVLAFISGGSTKKRG
jgi:hypothetical protein